MISKKKIFFLMFSAFLVFSIFASGDRVLAEESLEQRYNSELMSFGLSKEDISLMDMGMKEIILDDFRKEKESNPDSKLSYHQGEVKEYYFDKNDNLVERPATGVFTTFGTIPETDLKLFFSTANNGQNIQRIFANFEWTKKETAPREFVGFSTESAFDIVPNTYEARIMRRSQTYYKWQYYNNAGGRPYKINSNYGATWQWSGGSAYYKGHVSFKVDTDYARTGTFKMEYASDPGASSTSVNVEFGPVSIEHTLSNNNTMLNAPLRATIALRTGS